MTQTTVDQQVQMTGEPHGESDMPVKAGILLPHGTIAFIDATLGMLTNTSNSGANKVAGIMARRADNTSGGNGDISGVFYAFKNRFELPFNDAITQANTGDRCYAQDNFGLSPTATNASWFGVIEKFISSTKALVKPIFAPEDATS